MYVEDECKFYPAESLARVSRYKGHTYTVRDRIVVKNPTTTQQVCFSFNIIWNVGIRPPHSPPTANFKDLKWFLMSI